MDNIPIINTLVILIFSAISFFIYCMQIMFPELSSLFSLKNFTIVGIIVIIIFIILATRFNITKLRKNKEQKIQRGWYLKFSPLLELEVSNEDFEYIKFHINKAIFDKDVQQLEELEYYFLDELVALEKYKIYSKDAHNDMNVKFISEITDRLLIKVNKLRSDASDKLKVELDLLHEIK